MHEKVVEFMTTLFENGISWYTCIDCVLTPVGNDYQMRPLNQKGLKVIAEALQKAGLSIVEIRDLVARPESSDEAIMSGQYESRGCLQGNDMLRMLRGRYPENQEQKSA